MKKLLTVSLFAVMAVSAANAKIASTDYVDNTVSPVATKVGTANFTKGAAAGKADVTVAIDAVAEAVAGLSGDGANSVASQIATAKQELQDYADTAAGNALADAKEDAKQYIDATELQSSQTAQDTSLKAYADQKASAALTDAKADAEKYIDEAELTASQEAQDAVLKQYTDGVVSVVNELVGSAADTLSIITDAQTGILAQAKADAASKASAAQTAAEKTASDALSAHVQTASQTYETKTDATAKLNEAKSYADTAEADAIAAADTAAKAMIQLTKAMTDCANKQCALTINKGDILWEEVINQ